MSSSEDDLSNEQKERKWRGVYHALLNASVGESLEPLSLLGPFFDNGLINEAEKTSVEFDSSFTGRQCTFFLRLLPPKGQAAFDVLLCFLKDKAGRLDIADFLLFQTSQQESHVSDVAAKKSIAANFRSNDEEFVSVAHISPSAVLPALRVQSVDSVDAAVRRSKRSQLAYTPPPATPVINETGVRGILEKAKVYRIAANELTEDTHVCLGRGGYADVFGMVFHGRRVAVKKFRVFDEFSLKMFFEEIEIMRQLNHPNIVQFVGFVHEDVTKTLWMVTAYVHGGTLRRFCAPQKFSIQPLHLKKKISIAVCCWDGLDYLHNLRLCHKDIHPDNILVSDDLSEVKISDFGLSEFKFVASAYLTQKISGQFMYYPPEFASKQGYIRHATLSDVYSMGAVLCEFFSEKPFWHFTIDGQPYSIHNVMFTLINQLTNPSDPESLGFIQGNIREILQLAISCDFNKRPSAHELLEKFRSIS